MVSISSELRDIVGDTLELLGQAIRLEYGEKTYAVIESIRLKYKQARSADMAKDMQTNREMIAELKSLKPAVRFQIVHSFAISLEIINACENAFRSLRIKNKASSDGEHFEERITYVLTAHPTESRSPECIAIFTQITTLLIQVLEGKKELLKDQIFHLLLLSLKTPVSRTHKPEVADEAEYIYSIALRKDMLRTLIENTSHHRTVFLRTWVGGDKDGHPGVDAPVMKQSLTLSRAHLLGFTQDLLEACARDLELLTLNTSAVLKRNLHTEIEQLKKLYVIGKRDGEKIQKFRKRLEILSAGYRKLLHTDSPHLTQLRKLFFLFPGLVVPLELRESSTLIGEAVRSDKGAIVRMLKLIQEISQGGEALWYTRALVISTTESAEHILEAQRLVKKCMRSQRIPLVPLFESRHSLEASEAILTELFDHSNMVELCKKNWAGHFEVMLGYSDSAKENGSILSRSLIKEALFNIERFIQSRGLTPIFFHGSGGSVARGGGSLEEQVAWWPLSARKIFKVTIQGEMIYRSFAMPDIFNSQVLKILRNSKEAKVPTSPPHIEENLLDFAHQVSEVYKELVHNPEFLEVVEDSTPYTYLSELKIGSRPAKRVKTLGVESLRAIPWVLCWTQIRSLLPIWWGISTTWKKLSSTQKDGLKRAFAEDPFFTSFIKLLAFSMAKVDLVVWFSYMENSRLDPAIVKKYEKMFADEFHGTLAFIREISGQENILWFRPWLTDSIMLRSTMIHPLNMAQIIALQEDNMPLLRESVTGIASGMLTTG